MASIKELSKACGLSISAVSKALNGYPDVSEKTRKLVVEKAREMGYYPNALARGLKTNRTYNLGVVLDNQTPDGLLHHFFQIILNGFVHEAELHGYDITLINRGIGGQRLSYLDHCRYRNVDGLCLMCVAFDEPEIAEIVADAIPLVTIDRPFEGKECVCSDNRAGMASLVEYAVSMGHRRIAFLHGTNSRVTTLRIKAYRDTMAAYGLDIPEGYMAECEYQSASAQAVAVKRLLALPEPPTCILLSDDSAALGGMDAIQRAGLRIPEDISVAGYDGVALIQKLSPRLTTIRQNGETMGRRAAARLIDRIENPDAPVQAPDIIPGVLLCGETIARIGPMKAKGGKA